MTDCKKCCNMNANDNSSINNSRKKCNQIIYSDNYTNWLQQNGHYQKSLLINKNIFNCKYNNICENKSAKIKNINPEHYFKSHEDYINYQRANEIRKGQPNKQNPNKLATPFIGNPYFTF